MTACRVVGGSAHSLGHLLTRYCWFLLLVDTLVVWAVPFFPYDGAIHLRCCCLSPLLCSVRAPSVPPPQDFPDGEDVRESHPNYFAEKEKLLIKERVLLRVLHFDLTVDHAYKHVWAMTKTFIPASHLQSKVTQVAWNFINDSLRTYMHVQYCEREIAAAVFHLSAGFCRVPLPDGKSRDASGRRLIAWSELFPVDLERVHVIGNRIMDEYDPSMARPASAPDENGRGVGGGGGAGGAWRGPERHVYRT